MKKLSVLLAAILLMLSGCSYTTAGPSGKTVVAVTYPVSFLTGELIRGTDDLTVKTLIQEPISCLHDYTISTEQMKTIDSADLVVLSGAGLEDFMSSALSGVPKENIVDSSEGITLINGDPHIWLDPERAAQQAGNIAAALVARYPSEKDKIEANLTALQKTLRDKKAAWQQELKNLSCRELVTFHDGFTYFADAYDLTIAAAIEEEAGAEASASDLKNICDLMQKDKIPAVFQERNGSTNAASIISSEIGVKVFTLNTMMDGQEDYYTAMDENVAAVKEALG